MAKLYSEKLDKYYDMNDINALKHDEAEYDKQLADEELKQSEKVDRLHEVEDAYDAAYEAYMKAMDLKDKYVQDYGSIKLKTSLKCNNAHMYSPVNLMMSLYDLFDI